MRLTSNCLPTSILILLRFDPVTYLPRISESQILAYAQHLSEVIGYRTVGTREHALGDEWMMGEAQELARQCQNIAEANPGRKLQCEVWRQDGSGSHRCVHPRITNVVLCMTKNSSFDIMGKRLYKTYVGLPNTIMRISDGTDRGKEHAVLVNAHVDSTLPSPGAADDALSVGVMLECARVLIHTPNWEPTHAIIFCKSFLPKRNGIAVHDRPWNQCSTTPKNHYKTDHICSLRSTQSGKRSYQHAACLTSFDT